MLPFFQILVSATVLIQFAISQSTTNGSGSTSNPGCLIVDSTRPPQFISYERSEAGTKHRRSNGSRRVWLRLYNNTDCAIFVPTEGGQVSRLPSGSLSFDLQDGAESVLNYEVQDRRHHKAPRRVHGGDEIPVSRLLAGRSIVFSVLATHLEQQLDIVVPFRYEWERTISPLVGPVLHRVYFDADDLRTDGTSK